MITDQEKIRLIFGFKIKYLRQQKELSYQQLADLTGMSLSYLSDIEKGKKYPKIEKINALAKSLAVDYDYLVSTKATKKLQPIIDLFESEIFKIFPLDSFGIDPGKLIDMFVNAPDKLNAFVSTFLKIARNYELKKDLFYKTALRSYQDMFNNYFKELEIKSGEFRKEFRLKTKLLFKTAELESLLLHKYGISIDRKSLSRFKVLSDKRSYFKSDSKTLYMNTGLSPAQEKFLIGRELAFQFLEIEERPFITRPVEAGSFEKLLNNFRASYFSVALLIPEKEIIKDVRRISSLSSWDDSQLVSLLDKYDVTPEMLMQRLTNILPEHFNIKNLFFIRMLGDEKLKMFHMTKELHLSKLHSPYANVLNEHYCRKWISVTSIKNLHTTQRLRKINKPQANAQISKYWETDNEYLCLTIARKHNNGSGKISSVTVGLLISEGLRKVIRFLNDPNLKTRIVNNTCERCSMPDCEARAFAPIIIEEQLKREEIKTIVNEI